MNLNPASQLILYGHHFEFCNFIDLYKIKNYLIKYCYQEKKVLVNLL